MRQIDMDNCYETEDMLNNIDFSKDREAIVWEKIVSRLSKRADTLSSVDLNSIAGGLPGIAEQNGDYKESSKE